MSIAVVGGKARVALWLVFAIAVASPLLANTIANDYVSCTGEGVVKYGDTNFHVDPSDTPMYIYFGGVNGWTLLQPPNGLVVLQPFPDRKAWGAKNELKEAFASGFVEHCFFPIP